MGQQLVVALALLVSLTACGGSGSSWVPAPVRSATLPNAFNDYVTFGYDNGRDVFNPNSTEITPASLTNLHLAWQTGIGSGKDFNTQTQPVLATEIAGHAGVLFVGGALGNVYAYDALTGALLWTRSLGVETYACGGAAASFGIGGTVAYDPASRSLYAVGNANSGVDAAAANTLYHLDAASGAVLGKVNFSPGNLGPTDLNFSHTAVALAANGLAYVGTGATCDISSWRGRVAAISVPAMSLEHTFFTVWNASTQPWGGGGVWGWGGVALDLAGNVFTGVGNSDNGTTSHGSIVPPFVAAPQEYSANAEAFIELTPGLALEASQHPISTAVYGSSPVAVDLDVNGTPVVVSPIGAGCGTLAALQSKSGALYLYATARIAAGPVAQYQLAPPTYDDPFIGDPSYSPATGLIYAPVPVGAGSLYPPGMIAIDPGCGSPAVTWHTSFGPDSDLNGDGAARSVPAASAGGVVFVGTPCQPTGTGGCAGSSTPASARTSPAHRARKPALCCAPPSSTVGGAIWALDASSGAVLNGGLPLLTTPAVIRMPLTIDGRWLFVVDNGGDMYGLTIDQSVPAIAARYRAIDARSRRPWEARPAGPNR
jgi:predicted small lipoprotein YifL